LRIQIGCASFFPPIFCLISLKNLSQADQSLQAYIEFLHLTAIPVKANLNLRKSGLREYLQIALLFIGIYCAAALSADALRAAAHLIKCNEPKRERLLNNDGISREQPLCGKR
jgi:hypothetical protein